MPAPNTYAYDRPQHCLWHVRSDVRHVITVHVTCSRWAAAQNHKGHITFRMTHHVDSCRAVCATAHSDVATPCSLCQVCCAASTYLLLFYACIWRCTHIPSDVYMQTHARTHTLSLSLSLSLCLHRQFFPSIHPSIHLCLYLSIYLSLSLSISLSLSLALSPSLSLCLFICIYIYMYICVYVYIHTYRHTCTVSMCSSNCFVYMFVLWYSERGEDAKEASSTLWIRLLYTSSIYVFCKHMCTHSTGVYVQVPNYVHTCIYAAQM